ncbi:MAG: hypothetical protein MJZ79_00700 [Paludibacteraceae bacterium]|nr:hypothetical protein [Paludibacteraceae bacterium]
MKKLFLLTLAFASSVVIFAAKNVKTIHVTPDNATIFVNGSEVGNGSYQLKFDKHTDFVVLKFTAPGYIEKTVKLLKDNPKETIAYKLYEDEAMKQSLGSNDGVDMANKWMSITCKKGMTEDKVWKRLMAVAVDNFENIEVRDKSAGWIKTAWKDTNFESGQAVRTRLEIRVALGDEDELSYKVRVSSEIKWDPDCYGDQCWEKYPRVLRKFYDVLNDLQNSLGANN